MLAVFAGFAHAGTAITLGQASGYNVFVLGAYGTSGNTDIQGSVAVGGSFTSAANLSINEVPGSSSPSTVGLVVGGNLSLAGGQLDNTDAGDAWVGGSISSSSSFNFKHNVNYAGTFNSSNITVGGSTTKISASAIPINFTSAATALTQLSNTLQNMAANGSVVLSGSTYTLTATGCSVCVFDISASGNNGNFTGDSIAISAPSGATVVVNVGGTSDSLGNASITYSGGVTANDTIFNFNTATALSTTGMTVNGSILAPLATFTGTNGSVDGELIAAAVTGESAELESSYIFNGNLGTYATPEPATWTMMAVALAGLIVFRVRKARA